MSLRSVVKEWCPPALLKLLRGKPPASGWSYGGAGWNEDLEAGWQSPGPAEQQLRGWARFRELVESTGPLGIHHTDLELHPHHMVAHNSVMVFGYALALAGDGRTQISLLDWGGGIGHYALFARALLPGREIDYSCIETAPFRQAGRTALPDATFAAPESEWESRRYDLVLASGSLHYERDWKNLLARLGRATGRYLLLTRCPLVAAAASFTVIQDAADCGYNARFQGWFLNRQELLDAASEEGLTLRREFLIDERPEVPGAPEQAQYGGFLFTPPP